jgi:hypothetical protein
MLVKLQTQYRPITSLNTFLCAKSIHYKIRDNINKRLQINIILSFNYIDFTTFTVIDFPSIIYVLLTENDFSATRNNVRSIV